MMEPMDLLTRVDALKTAYGGDAAERKLQLLGEIDRHVAGSARDVLRLHEFLCFLRAYPDSPQVLDLTVRLLDTFHRRADLRRHRRALADTGVAGTTIQSVFFWFTARWLATRFPDRLTIDWPELDSGTNLERLLPLVLPYAESPTLEQTDMPLRRLIARLKGPGETDAAFLTRRFEQIHPTSFGREILYEGLRIPMTLAPGPGAPSRTRAACTLGPPRFQTRPLDRSRPNLRVACRRPPLRVRHVTPDDADRLIDLARDAMVLRARDLDNFIHADRRDVRVYQFEDGLSFICYGLTPERRLLVESVYGMLTLKNGVPIGYVLASGLFQSSEVMYNVFETFRGGESARVYGRVLAMVRHLFGADTFAVDPFQLGHDNREGQQSGAFWFYYKLGFRPVDAAVRRLVREEIRRLARHPHERSTPRTIHRLAAAYMFLRTAGMRRDVLGELSPGDIGLGISRSLAERFGGDRERGVRTCVREAATITGVRTFTGWTPAERLAWERWSPLVVALPGLDRWPAADRRALVGVVRAKGGRRESEYVRRFDAHPRLRVAMLRLAAP